MRDIFYTDLERKSFFIKTKKGDDLIITDFVPVFDFDENDYIIINFDMYFAYIKCSIITSVEHIAVDHIRLKYIGGIHNVTNLYLKDDITQALQKMRNYKLSEIVILSDQKEE